MDKNEHQVILGIKEVLRRALITFSGKTYKLEEARGFIAAAADQNSRWNAEPAFNFVEAAEGWRVLMPLILTALDGLLLAEIRKRDPGYTEDFQHAVSHEEATRILEIVNTWMNELATADWTGGKGRDFDNWLDNKVYHLKRRYAEVLKVEAAAKDK